MTAPTQGGLPVELAVIPAAGRGMRLRPATRAVPKAFVPIVDRPALHYVVDEAVQAGATEIITVVSPDARSLVESYFSPTEPESGLEGVKVTVVEQVEPRGLGHAVLLAEDAVAGRPFYCLLVDNLVRPGRSILGELAAAAVDGLSVLCLRELPDEALPHHGVIAEGSWPSGRVVEVKGAVEKPSADVAPSNLAILGRYLFSDELFPALREVKPGHGSEIQLTDAIDTLGGLGRCLGLVTEDDLLDIGTPLSLLQAATVYGAAHPEWGAEYRAFVAGLQLDGIG